MRFIPLHIFPHDTKLDFMGKRWWGFGISLLLTLISMWLVFERGLNLGIDFTGGILIEVRSEQKAELGAMRAALDGKGLGEVSLQNFGDVRDVMIRIQVSETDEQAVIVAHVKELLSSSGLTGLEYRKIDYVGPTVGQELIRAGIISVLLSFGAIMLYMWFRFEWQYGVGGILALLHDSIMMMGFFAITQFEFGLTAIAAILTIIGYSINDSVVIYDRVRENMRRFKKTPMDELLNKSINDTISRTVLTASTTLLAALSLYFFGGEVIRGFSASMAFGVIVGTYSSIYISGPALIYLGLRDTSLEEEVAT